LGSSHWCKTRGTKTAHFWWFCDEISANIIRRKHPDIDKQETDFPTMKLEKVLHNLPRFGEMWLTNGRELLADVDLL